LAHNTRFIDMVGRVFNRLTVIKRADSNNKFNQVVWECECKCGNTFFALGTALRQGTANSCGCLKREKTSELFSIDLIGKRFGRLVVVSRSNNKNFSNYKWLCKCDCGNTVEVAGGSLQQGATNSCGCLRKEVVSNSFSKDMVGQKFGKLIVIKKIGIKRKLVLWECLCDCGNVVNVIGAYLRNGETKSCGCLNESSIANELKQYCIKNHGAIPEYKTVKNPETNFYLPFDIYVPNNIFIEVNWLQHYEFIPRFHIDQEGFEHDKKLDRIKKKYAKKNGLYIEIDLRKVKTIEDAIIIIEKKIKKYRKTHD
jgi:hypothetical protein